MKLRIRLNKLKGGETAVWVGKICIYGDETVCCMGGKYAFMKISSVSSFVPKKCKRTVEEMCKKCSVHISSSST